jgi:hypothetical protein
MNAIHFNRHRYSAVVWIVAIAVMVPSSAARAAKPTDALQSLLLETAAQIDLAYRQYPAERDLRHRRLAEVLNLWRAAERTETNNERLASWLSKVISSSMPGSDDQLPAAPHFVATTNAKPVGPSMAKEKQVEPKAEIAVDPFRDDS